MARKPAKKGRPEYPEVLEFNLVNDPDVPPRRHVAYRPGSSVIPISGEKEISPLVTAVIQFPARSRPYSAAKIPRREVLSSPHYV